MRRKLVLLFGVTAALVGCERLDMYTQHKYRYWDRNNFFADKSSMRRPVPGTVARNAPNAPVPQPETITAAMLARGHERFDIFCSPCHGRTGTGEGMIVRRGFPHPPSLISGDLQKAKAKHFWEVITDGHGAMYSYATRVPPADRWAIIAYIRALQLSQDADPATLPGEDLAKLEARR